jgi:hypothetical protein
MRIVPGSPAGKALPTRPPAADRTAAPRPFIAVLGERIGSTSSAPPPAVPSPTLDRPSARPPASPLGAMLERAVGGEKQIDALLDAAARGKTFKPGELLAMQATVARYSQTVEVVSRVADRLVGAVKQTMGTQV